MSRRSSPMREASYYPAQNLLKAIERAHKEQAVIGALYTSERCPFCIALKREQLSPRMRSEASPEFIVVEFDPDLMTPFTLPNGQRLTSKMWGSIYKLTLFPTLVMLDDSANPITPPLVGYASRDFYPAYLEEAIQTAHATVSKQRAARPSAAPVR